MTASILDCTLRDGAHVNHGEFGRITATAIVQKLITSKIDMIELGFLEQEGVRSETTYFKSIDQCAEFFSSCDRKESAEFGLMLRTDRCSIDELKKHSFIQFIRVAFYPEHLKDAIRYLAQAKEKGYKVYANLIAVTRYSESDIRNMLKELNAITVDGVSIVDTYGSLDRSTLSPIIRLFNESMNHSAALGLHLHENISESISMIDVFQSADVNRKKIYDGAIGGMGRVPGNIPTELLANYLNKYGGANYDTDLLLRAATLTTPFMKLNKWGYLPIYAYSAIKKIDRSYPEYFESLGLSEEHNMLCQDAVYDKAEDPRFDQDLANNILQSLGFNYLVDKEFK